MIETVRVAFYDAKKGNCYDKFVGLFDDYSHVEIQIKGICWSSSPRDGGFRSKRIDLTSGKWTILHIVEPVDFYSFMELVEKFEGMGYDWSVILNYLGIKHDFCNRRLWCGEVVAKLFNALYHTNVAANVPLTKLYGEIWNIKRYTASIIRY